MKKVLLAVLLGLSLFSCKSNVNNEIKQQPSLGTGETVFIKKIDSSKSISRSQMITTGTGIEMTEWDEAYTTLKNKVNSMTGRSSESNDVYFVFDEKGNILEIGAKFLSQDNTNYGAIAHKFKKMENNFPVLMARELDDYTLSSEIVSIGDYNGDPLNQMIDIKLNDENDLVENGINFINRGTYIEKQVFNEKRSRPVRDLQGKILSIAIGEFSTRIDSNYFDISYFEDLVGNSINKSNYENKSLKFEEDNTISLYSGKNKVGTAKNATYAYTFKDGKIETFTIEEGSNKYIWTYNSNGDITEWVSTQNNLKNTYEYDNHGVLAKVRMLNNGVLKESSDVTYTMDSRFNLLKSFNRVDKYYGDNGGVEDESTYFMEYTRDNAGKITQVETDIFLYAPVKGIFIPKN